MQDNSNYINSNMVSITGVIASEKIFSHEVYGEGFYNFFVEVERLSDASDFLPVTVSERIIDENFVMGKKVHISGQIRSYNNYAESEGRSRLVLTVFVKDLVLANDEMPDGIDEKTPNDVYLKGYICKTPIYRTTPFGREIADLLIAVNRSYKKSDYIPCIAWGRNARFSNKLEVGDNITIWGRMQSRVYQKKIDEENTIERTAYEVSVSKLEFNAVEDDPELENNE